MNKIIIDKLKAIQIFSSFSDDELIGLSGRARIKRYKKNETILYEEDTSEYMYIILSGKVKAIQISEDGKEILLAIHQAGEFFGEMSLIDGKTAPATVVAMQETLTAIISRNDFFALLYSQNKFTERLLQIMCLRLRNSWDTIQMLNFNNAAQRLKMLFFKLSDEYGEKSAEGITLGIKLTHRDIANMAGIARETVTRVIDKWQKDRAIAILKDKHIRLGPDFLKKDINLT